MKDLVALSANVFISNKSLICFSFSLQVHPEKLGFQEGDTLTFKYLGIDKIGRVLASRKAVLPPSNKPSRSPRNRTRNFRKGKTEHEDDILDYLDRNDR